jgi:sulfane dehydrogenase subunit SoxC
MKKKSHDSSHQSAAPTRRRFLQHAASIGFGTIGGSLIGRATAAAEIERGPGDLMGALGARAPAVKLGRICGGGPGQPTIECDLANNSKTPLQRLSGIITPSDLHFERSHSGVPALDAATHRLLVHGLVDRPRTFSMDDLMRMPSTSRISFIECAGNGWDNWKQADPKLTVQETHGLISTSEWTGVPLAFLLDEIGAKREARWMLAEGGDGSAVDRSIPLTEFIRSNAIIAYAQNGEPLRPANGYPLRLLVPGLEGNMNIKWLRRLKFGAEPFMTRWETARYTRLRPDGKAEQFVLVQDANSVITSPSGGMTVKQGFNEIRGFAWSGYGRVAKVDVSADGGKNWTTSNLQAPILPQAQTVFRMPWRWDGQPALLQSRCTDEVGRVQMTRAEIVGSVGTNAVYHYNAIQTWKVDTDGGVTNAFA